MGELKECHSDADIAALSLRVQSMMSELAGVPNTKSDILVTMKNAAKALHNDGQSVKGKRMQKMHKLLSKLPKESPKKQRKMLREILALVAKNMGIQMEK